MGILEGGRYTFWVETDRQREDQNVLWRLSIDSQILEIQEPEVATGRKSRLSRKSTRRNFRPGSASRTRAFDSQSDSRSDAGVSDSCTQSEAGESSIGDASDNTSDTGSCSSQPLSRCSSTGSFTPQRTASHTP